MSIRADSATLSPGRKIRLYSLDGTVIDPLAGTLNFHGYNDDGIIVWQGVEYHPWAIEASGFKKSGDKPATPSLSVENRAGAITALCLQFDDMIGAVLTVRTTLSKYLDAVNFEGGLNPTADPNEHYPDEVWFLDRKEFEDNLIVKWGLSSALDFNGVVLPRRMIVSNQCWWQYRSAECSYAGPPVAKYDDTPTSDPLLDDCSRKVSGCKLRFGDNNPLPFGSFPASGLMRS